MNDQNIQALNDSIQSLKATIEDLNTKMSTLITAIERSSRDRE